MPRKGMEELKVSTELEETCIQLLIEKMNPGILLKNLGYDPSGNYCHFDVDEFARR